MADIGLRFWLTQWNWEPSIVVGTAVMAGLYLYGVGPARRRYKLAEEVPWGNVAVFLTGMALMFLALVSPLDELGDSYLFSAHMLQHLFLTIVGPPLLLLGTPDWLLQSVLGKRVAYVVARWLTFPAVAFFLFNADFWLWHAPPLYNATLEHANVHILEHMTFIVFGVLYWWPIFSPMKKGLTRLSMGGQLLYLFLSGMPSVALGAGLTFLPPLYAPYIAAPRIWGLSAATDQQLGGLIMWVPVSIAYIIIASVLFIRWMQQQDEKQRASEAAALAQAEAGAAAEHGAQIV